MRSLREKNDIVKAHPATAKVSRSVAPSTIASTTVHPSRRRVLMSRATEWVAPKSIVGVTIAAMAAQIRISGGAVSQACRKLPPIDTPVASSSHAQKKRTALRRASSTVCVAPGRVFHGHCRARPAGPEWSAEFGASWRGVLSGLCVAPRSTSGVRSDAPVSLRRSVAGGSGIDDGHAGNSGDVWGGWCGAGLVVRRSRTFQRARS